MGGKLGLVAKFVIHRRLRSFLTTLGIAIGVALIFSLVSINRGLMSAVAEQLEQIGGDIITVVPKFSGPLSSQPFSNEELDALRRLPFVRDVAGIYSTVLPVELSGRTEYLAIYGYSPEDITRVMNEIQSFRVERGREFREGENHKLVIGYLLADRYNLGPGSRLRIAGRDFRVVGVLEKIGNSEDDMSINANVEDLWELTGEDGTYNYIMLTVSEPNDDRIKRELKKVRGQEDFDVFTPESFMERAGQVLGIVNAIFLAVASISILVGGIGVANTMYMAVFERTHEIGVMKAVGASERDVLTIFLLESGLLSLIGGLFGMALGWGLAWGVGHAAATFGGTEYLHPVLSADIFLLTAALSFVVGLLSGFFPARYAAKLEPVEALRYE